MIILAAVIVTDLPIVLELNTMAEIVDTRLCVIERVLVDTTVVAKDATLKIERTIVVADEATVDIERPS